MEADAVGWGRSFAVERALTLVVAIMAASVPPLGGSKELLAFAVFRLQNPARIKKMGSRTTGGGEP